MFRFYFQPENQKKSIYRESFEKSKARNEQFLQNSMDYLVIVFVNFKKEMLRKCS